MKTILPIIALLCCVVTSYAQQWIKGTVISRRDNKVIPAVSVKILNTNNLTKTDEKGRFSIQCVTESVTLSCSAIGFKTKEVKLSLPLYTDLLITLEEDIYQLHEVTISTGYQTLPKDRATGSFVKVDNELLNRRVSTNILDRLEDVTSGLIFNKGKAGQGTISIRGQNTIYGNASPLFVIDNFPYEGDMSNVNPNDVESITVLKDAAAASIWGARAGNGVVVITTKKGKYNQAPLVVFNTNLTFGNKPNLFYQSRMSSVDFIDVEKKLFAQGYYTQFETATSNPALTPVVELLIAKRNNPSLSTQVDAQIESLKSFDVRNDFEKYFYQKSIKQQYSVNINGGSKQYRYYISSGYDHNMDNLVNNGYDRFTLNTGNTFLFFKDKLEATATIYFTQGKTIANNPGTSYIGLNSGSGLSLYPYAKLADENGNALAINHDYRANFIQAAQNAGFLNWTYKPLDELNTSDNTSKSIDYRINTSLRYKIVPSLSAEVLYQYGGTQINIRNLQSAESYFTRNLINKYTQVSTAGILSYPVPKGSILDLGNSSTISQSIRGQLNYAKTWQSGHEWNAIAGYELRDYHTLGTSNRMYGYNDERATLTQVDYVGTYSQYNYPGTSANVPFNDNVTDLTDRYISYYANAAYTFKERYTLSGSGRLDRSNLFGVNANQQGTPLYSVGLSWDINKEGFYMFNELLPYLKIRATYGYNGNVNKSLSAYTTAIYLSGNAINQTYAKIVNPPNPELRWERVRMINVGIDFATKGNRITGTVEPYFKSGIDLVGDIAYAPSTGITTFRGNTANTKGHGIDVTLNSQNLTGAFKWATNFLFSYVTDKVVNYDLKQAAVYYTQFGDTFIYPLEGKSFYALYSYKWAGLDPQTGDPQGYLNGTVSKDYASILSAATPNELVYSGSARPTTFGAFRNTFFWKQFSISANITYRFGYFFRKPGISYNNILTGQGYYYGSYANRWQKPGDELLTNIPSMPTTINANRDNFYNYSESTIEKGDNIRLQDISLSYDLTKKQLPGLPFSKVQLYIYANNVGMVWKASKTNLDPDYPNADYIPVRSLSIGLKIGF